MKKIESTRQIAQQTVLRLYKKGYGYAQGSVVDSAGTFFLVATDRAFMNHLNDGDQVDVYLWIEECASYEVKLIIVGRITVGDPVLVFTHSDILTRNTERRCLRARVSIPARFFVLDTGKEEKGMSTGKIVHHGGVITELSDREAVVSSMDRLQSRNLIKLHAFIGSQDLEIVARIEDVRSEDDQFYYFVSFIDLHAHDRKELLNFIYNTFRE